MLVFPVKGRGEREKKLQGPLTIVGPTPNCDIRVESFTDSFEFKRIDATKYVFSCCSFSGEVPIINDKPVSGSHLLKEGDRLFLDKEKKCAVRFTLKKRTRAEKENARASTPSLSASMEVLSDVSLNESMEAAVANDTKQESKKPLAKKDDKKDADIEKQKQEDAKQLEMERKVKEDKEREDKERKEKEEREREKERQRERERKEKEERERREKEEKERKDREDRERKEKEEREREKEREREREKERKLKEEKERERKEKEEREREKAKERERKERKEKEEKERKEKEEREREKEREREREKERKLKEEKERERKEKEKEKEKEQKEKETEDDDMVLCSVSPPRETTQKKKDKEKEKEKEKHKPTNRKMRTRRESSEALEASSSSSSEKKKRSKSKSRSKKTKSSSSSESDSTDLILEEIQKNSKYLSNGTKVIGKGRSIQHPLPYKFDENIRKEKRPVVPVDRLGTRHRPTSQTNRSNQSAYPAPPPRTEEEIKNMSIQDFILETLKLCGDGRPQTFILTYIRQNYNVNLSTKKYKPLYMSALQTLVELKKLKQYNCYYILPEEYGAFLKRYNLEDENEIEIIDVEEKTVPRSNKDTQLKPAPESPNLEDEDSSCNY